MLEVIGISGSRNDNVLFKNLNFTLSDGQALQINAANGVGKTTLLKIIAGLLPIAAGKITTDYSALYLGHNSNLHPALSVQANLKFLHLLNSRSSSVNSQHMQLAIQNAGINKQLYTAGEELSAGQAQRVNLARLYLAQEKLWLLDEPFVNLDNNAKLILTNLLIKHLLSGGALIIASHNQIELAGVVVGSLYLEQYA